ncbi:MAG: DUF3467 domain-containing protein [Euzebyales bacterium]|nr:DUF3467 domain-containing protein [Euzebyales bacterium]MBA3622171.1 DUF3467 domain-containing protein [Euzebyales bacterium]
MTDPDVSGPEDGGQHIQISLDDSIKHGAYANFLVVSHSAHEFTLDFCQVLPGGDAEAVQADVVSRVKVAPTMVGKVIRALNTNMTAYEDAFGMVREVG